MFHESSNANRIVNANSKYWKVSPNCVVPLPRGRNCCSVLQCVAVCCSSVLQCVAVSQTTSNIRNSTPNGLVLISILFVTWTIHTCDMTHSYVSHDPFMCVWWPIHMCDTTHSYLWHVSFICVIWPFHMCDMTYSNVWHDSCIRVTWLIHMCDMTRSSVSSTLQHNPTHFSTLQHTATHCNTLQHTAT